MPRSLSQIQKESLEKLYEIFQKEPKIVDLIQDVEVIENELAKAKPIKYEIKPSLDVKNTVEHALSLIDSKYKIILEFGVWEGDSLYKIRKFI
jgi:hypothetical protein